MIHWPFVYLDEREMVGGAAAAAAKGVLVYFQLYAHRLVYTTRLVRVYLRLWWCSGRPPPTNDPFSVCSCTQQQEQKKMYTKTAEREVGIM